MAAQFAGQSTSQFAERARRIETDHAARLSDTRLGQRATVMRIEKSADPFVRGRLLDLGLTPGTVVEHQLDGSMGEVAAYRVRGTLIALRKDQAQLIRIEPIVESLAG